MRARPRTVSVAFVRRDVGSVCVFVSLTLLRLAENARSAHRKKHRVSAASQSCCERQGDDVDAKRSSSCCGDGDGNDGCDGADDKCDDGCCGQRASDRGTADAKKSKCGESDGCCGELSDDEPIGGGSSTAAATAATAATTTTTMSVVGMTCTDCADSAEKLLRKLPGVVAVDASFSASRVVVKHDSLLVSAAALVERLGKLKFTGAIVSSDVDGADHSNDSRRFVVVLDVPLGDSLSLMRAVRGVERVDVDTSNKYATVSLADGAKRRDIIDAFAAAKLPSRLHDAAAAAAAMTEAAEQRELRRVLVHVVLATAIAIPLALMTFAFPQRIAPVVRLSVGFALCTIVQLFTGSPLYASALRALRYNREANVDCLIMLSTTVAYVYSTIVWLAWLARGAVPGDEAETFFETPAILLALIVIGRYLEKRAKRRTSDALRSLRALQAPTAQLICESDDEQAPLRTIDCSLIDVGDLLRVEPGARVPVDGVVERGSSSVDESMVTGEVRAQLKVVGATMLGGTNNIDGCVVLRATATVQTSTVSRIAQLMTEAQVR